MTTFLPDFVTSNAQLLVETAEAGSGAEADPREKKATVILVIGGCETIWEVISELLSQGLEGGMARRLFSAFDMTTAAARRAIDNLASASPPCSEPGAIAELTKRVESIRARAAELRSCLKKEPPPGFFDRAMKAISESKGVYESSEDIMARIEAGGEL